MDSAMPHDNSAASRKGQEGAQHNFLALIPRGLEHTITKLVQEAVDDAVVEVLVGKGFSSSEVGKRAQETLREKQRIKKKPPNPWFRHPVGSVALANMGHYSVGYTSDQTCAWSVPGTLEGSIWLQITTSQIERVSSLRCIAPLMALIATTDDIESLVDPNHEMDLLLEEISKWLSRQPECHGETYLAKLEKSIQLWREYVDISWRNDLSHDTFKSLQERIRENKIRFRMSCMRDHADAVYPRQDFLRELMSRLGGILLPHYGGDAKAQSGWRVNLKEFDLEFVVILLSSGRLAFCISLVPYPFFKAKGFYPGGVPPDISKPYLGFEALEGLVRLRPTTAHMLLDLASVRRYETVLDPCAGIGTIPMEADIFYKSAKCIGLGGDVALNHASVARAAGAMEGVATNSHRRQASLLAAWDAAYLPMREGCVDAIVSDLPFGKQCLSNNALKQLLPLVLSECARVLVPSTGRLLVLCGNPSLTDSLEISEMYWKKPCTMIFPVTIGGLQAWVIRIERNCTRWDPASHPRLLERVRNLARRRDRITKHQKSLSKDQTKKRRRVQA